MIGPTPLSDAERTLIRKTLYLLFNDNSTLVDLLTKTFHSLAFENRFSLHPRRLKELAIELVVSLDAFLLSNDPSLTHELGKQHAFEGMGEKLVLLVGQGIHQFFFDIAKPSQVEILQLFHKVVDNYVTNYLLGYMLGREQYTLQEQERLRNAVLEVQKRVAEEEAAQLSEASARPEPTETQPDTVGDPAAQENGEDQ